MAGGRVNMEGSPEDNPSSTLDSDTEAPADNLSDGDTELLRSFIKTYETLSVLWNRSHPKYSNKFKRNAALGKLLQIFIKLKPGATIMDVRRKINSLRSNYRKELKKILSSKSSGASADNVYSPTSWVFYALKFLDGFEQPVNSNVRNQQIEFTVCHQLGPPHINIFMRSTRISIHIDNIVAISEYKKKCRTCTYYFQNVVLKR